MGAVRPSPSPIFAGGGSRPSSSRSSCSSARAAATLALSILVETNEPFDHAFAAANGAHLVIDYDAAVSDAQLAATAAAGGVTSSAGPWPVAASPAWQGSAI